MISPPFAHHEAFSRNLGFITEWELNQLRHKRIAIAGAGGVGGVHLITLARLGIGAFHIADMDVFELANFNRQAGALISTLGQPKVDVMAAMARDINPELDLRTFPQGIHADNIEAFLQGVDVYVDALDFFALEARIMVFAACARLGIPAVTVAPMGMGAGLMNFLPGRMTFNSYFGLEGVDKLESYTRLLVGLGPRAPHGRYLVDRTRLDLEHQRAPSTPMGVYLCAGVAGTEVLKILLRRGKVFCAPYAITYDAYLNRRVVTWRPGGYRNPLTQLRLWFARRIVKRIARSNSDQPHSSASPATPLMKILDLARWAPSGDNEQPWRFEVLSDRSLVVHFTGNHTADVYDYAGLPGLLSLGCLTESLRLAATQHGWSTRWHYESHACGGLLHVSFDPEAGTKRDPLGDFLEVRSVDRRPYRLQSLSSQYKQNLEEALGDEFEVRWFESLVSRWRMSRLNMQACRIRLGLPEAIRIHRRVLDWQHARSVDRIPSQAIGAGALTQRLMRWVLHTEQRAEFFLGKVPGGTLGAQIEMELLPGLCSAGYFAVARRQRNAGSDPEQWIRAGQAVQRFWLTATRLGLALQPNVAMQAFVHYGRNQTAFSMQRDALARSRKLAAQFSHLCTEQSITPESIMFTGRIGVPKPSPLQTRSIRKPLYDLLTTDSKSKV